MTVLVKEVMNHELFFVAPGELARHVLGYLKTLNLTAAPVLDRERRPVGFISIRDMAGCPEGALISQQMSAPPLSVRSMSSVEEAGRLMAEGGGHHLVVIDEEGRAVGMISSLDVIRGLLGITASHPEALSRQDRRAGLTVGAAPEGPGVFVPIP